MTETNVTTVGQQLVDMCKAGQWNEAIDELYADSIVSVEPFDGPDMPRKLEGIEAVRAMSRQWEEANELHSCEVKGPFPHGEDRFAVIFDIDVTNKPMNVRMQMEEVALYTVEGGKIARVEFFYQPPQ